MYRITIDIDGDDTLAAKEAVACRLEELGRVRIVQIKPVGTGIYRLTVDVDGDDSRAGKSVVTTLLAPLGNLQVVSIVINGKEKK